MIRSTGKWPSLVLAIVAFAPFASAREGVRVDRSAFSPQKGGVDVKEEGGAIRLAWPIDANEFGRLTIDLNEGKPLVAAIGASRTIDGPIDAAVEHVDPVAHLTVGTRSAPLDRPPTMSVFNVFFDTPADRPHETFRSKYVRKSCRIANEGKRTTIAIGDVTIGSFEGEWVFTIYPGSGLIRLEAVVTTNEPNRAILPEISLIGASPDRLKAGWFDVEGRYHEQKFGDDVPARPLAVKHRAIVVATPDASLACFPPPHQYLFPRDLTDNTRLVWFGKGYRGSNEGHGFGVRQDETGGGRYVPWFNAIPGNKNRLGVFLLVSSKPPKQTLDDVLKYTHHDRYKPIEGRKTFTTHWHMAIAQAAIDRLKRGEARDFMPDWVKMFKDMGVNIVHLGEFHGDGHQKDPGPIRLPEFDALFDECKRLSNNQLLVLPGEEVDEFLGLPAPGRQSGHWMILFPRPVYWVMRRSADQPFVDKQSNGRTIYRVRHRADLLKLIDLEHALVWSSHPRIKASTWTPDVFRQEGFYKANSWLGAAWKAMPADLSSPRLGTRVLDLFDDMCLWGDRKQVVGEVDVFKIDHTHELYGHMNINYIKIDRTPRFRDGWGEVLDRLREGKFFTTTGEVLIHDFRVGGVESGDELKLADVSTGATKVKAKIEWTFPLAFAELVYGDDTKRMNKRIDLSDVDAFGERTLEFDVDLRGMKWARFEVWDVAANGAFTQPVWIGTAAVAQSDR